MATKTDSYSQAEQSFDQLFPETTVYTLPCIFLTKTDPTAEESLLYSRRRVLTRSAKKEQASEDRRRGEEAELKFLRRLQSELRKTLQPGDPPCFILHNFASDKDGSVREVDSIVLHKTLCVLLVEVKAKESPCVPEKFRNLARKAVGQLNKAREMIEEKIGQQPIKAIVTFPNLTENDKEKTKKEAEKFSKENEVTIMYGDSSEVYQEMLSQQQDLSFSFPDCKDSTLAFKFAVVKLTKELVRRPTFGQAVKLFAKQYEYCFLTEDQLQILNSNENRLHLYGPHGAGKSILLVLKAQQWMQQECKVIVLVGHENLDPLLQSLGKEIGSAPNKKGELHVFRITEFQEVQKDFETPYSGNIFVIADEYAEHHKDIDDLMEQRRISAMWSAHVRPLPANSRLQQRGLKQSIRCPPQVVDLLNQINPDENVNSFSENPHHTLLNSEPSFIFHDPQVCKHKNFRSYSECPECQTKMEKVFKDLGLRNESLETSTDEPTSTKQLKKKKRKMNETYEDLHWGDVLIILSGWIDDPKDVEAVEQWFQQLKVPALWERPMEFERDGRVLLSNDSAEMQPLPTNTQSQRNLRTTGGEQAERETKTLPPDGWRNRILNGVDRDGKPCVHFVHSLDFQGLEKYVVIVVHHDWRDLHKDHQTEEKVKERLQKHRDCWYRSVSRCLGKVIVLAATPSPLCQLLLQAEADH